MAEEESQHTSDGEVPQTLSSTRIFDINFQFPDLVKVAGNCERVTNNLIKAISAGVSRLYGPHGVVRDAEAEREAVLIRARTVRDLAKMRDEISQGSKPTLEQRAINHLLDQTIAKQVNREWIAAEAIREIEQAPPLSDADQEINADWLGPFWTVAEVTSEADARKFLAHLLAKEIERPESVSPQTLSVLPILTGELARKFQHFCRLSIDDGHRVYVIHPNVFAFQHIGPLDNFGVSYDDLFEFDDCRLIRSAQTIEVNFAAKAAFETVNYAGKTASLKYAGLQLQLLQFTRAGTEIRRLLSLTAVEAYTTALQQMLGNAFALDQDSESHKL